MDRLKSMSTFVSVVENGGFSAAARSLSMPLATVSRKVSELEENLGIRLLNRNTRQVTLTDSGRDYFESCRRILSQLDDAERAVVGEYRMPRGELIVTAPIVFGRMHLVPLITELLSDYPDLTIKLLLVDRVVNLIEEHADVAIRIGALPDSALVSTTVGQIRRVVTASPDYLERHGTPQDLTNLSSFDCILITALSTGHSWTFCKNKAMCNVEIKPRLIVTTAAGGIGAAIAGAGLVQTLCYQVASDVSAGRLCQVLKEFEPPYVPVNIVYPSGRLMPAKLRTFLDFMTPRLRKNLHSMDDCT